MDTAQVGLRLAVPGRRVFLYWNVCVVLVVTLCATPTLANREMTVDLPGGATMDFVWIEPGTFTMGSPPWETGRVDNEGPQHEVTISRGFWLGRCEMTQGQWEAVMDTRPWKYKGRVVERREHPAVNISFDEVEEMVGRLNAEEGATVYRLPTEAEWEYACRAGTTTPWSFGGDEGRIGEFAWYRANALKVGLEHAQPVGTKQPNPWGLFDMHGNVWELCQDFWGGYSHTGEAEVDPQGAPWSLFRVYRGGSLGSVPAQARSARRKGEDLARSSGSVSGARLLRMEHPVPTAVTPQTWGRVRSHSE